MDMISSGEEEPIEIIKGSVLVGRNPCTHPGDIRLLQAVDKPELHHFFNVVVFSSLGSRPQCHKMAGGDLDGDVYLVTWEDLLVKPLSQDSMVEPAIYAKPTVLKEKPETDSLPDHFIFYL
jgi:hypothetical protein